MTVEQTLSREIAGTFFFIHIRPMEYDKCSKGRALDLLLVQYFVELWLASNGAGILQNRERT